MASDDVQTLERGHVWFFYRPKVEEADPGGLDDVQRTYMLLAPDDGEGKKPRYRLAVVGRKRLPDPGRKGRGRTWGFVERVSRKPEDIKASLREEHYGTKTRGERTVPAARPAGEGVYRIVRHGDHTHLVYALELPRTPGDVQDALNLEPDASYILSIKNPERQSGSRPGLSPDRAAEYPKKLQEVFRGRSFADADPPALLDHEGAQFLLVSAAEDVKEELGIELDTEHESLSEARLFDDLDLDRREHPVAPLERGEWT